MSLYTLIIVTFVIFMAINVIIGLRGRKHASTTKDFLTASGQSGIWFIIASAVGASIGSGVVIGTTQYAVKLGVAGAWYAIACGLACVVHAFVMTRFIYRNKLVSFSDYFKRRYDSNFIILLYSGIGPFACAASMGGQLVAAKAIFQAFGIDPTIGLVITAAVMLVYTMFAGLWGSYATAVFQVGVIIVGVLVVGISMFTQGGVAEIHAFYPAEKFDLFNISPELWMMFVGPMVLSVLVDQTSVQRAASAKTEATAFWGHLLSCIPLFLFGWLMVYIGMWSGAEFPDAGGNAFIVMLMNKVSPIVCAVMICAILAAIMSTASGALVATDALVVHDHEHKRQFAYEAHTACDKNGFVLETVVTPGNVHDSVAFDEVYDKVTENFPQVESVVADAAYKTPHICKKVFGDGRVLSTAYKRPQTKNCIKTVQRHIWKDYEELADDARYTPAYAQLYKCRKETIERVFADAKEKHAMRYTQYRGLAQVTNWVKLKFVAMNLKKLATWKWRDLLSLFRFAVFSLIYVRDPVCS